VKQNASYRISCECEVCTLERKKALVVLANFLQRPSVVASMNSMDAEVLCELLLALDDHSIFLTERPTSENLH
jgi:hypothetical protein